MSLILKWKRASLIQKAAVAALAIVTLYTATGFLILGPLVKYGLSQGLEKALSREISIQKISINPYAFSAKVQGLSIIETNGNELFGFEKVSVNIRVFASIVNAALVVGDISVINPRASIVLEKDGSFNFSDIINKKSGPEPATTDTQKTGPPGFVLKFAKISGGDFYFEDRQKNVKHVLSDVSISIWDVSGLLKDQLTPANVSVWAEINNAPVAFVAESLLFSSSQKTSIAASLNNFSAKPYLSYIKPPDGIKVVSAKTNFFCTSSYEKTPEGPASTSLESSKAEIKIKILNTELIWTSSEKTPQIPNTLDMEIFFVGAKAKLNKAHESDVNISKLEIRSLGLFANNREKTLARLDEFLVSDVEIKGARSAIDSVSIKEILLSGLFAGIVLEPDGAINYTKLLPKAKKQEPEKPEEKKPATQAPDAPLPDISLETLALANAQISFIDQSVKPAVSTAMQKLEGVITNISSSTTSRATVSLKGNLDGQAPLNITGKINVLTKDPFIDLTVGFNDIEMSPFSPYMAKYVGFRLKKGKLTLAHKYEIADQKIDGKNLIIIDQLTLGEKVDSPDAIKAPVQLALALLKDRNGRIELDVPIAGGLDDPEFKIGKVVAKTLANIIIKVALSPFAALGAMFGGGEELAFVEFEPGTDNIKDKGSDKLATLAMALYERPFLNLDIQGDIAPAQDGPAIMNMKLINLLKAVKQKKMGKSAENIPLADIIITKKEYEKLLWAVYKDADFEKQKNAVGLIKKLEPVEMKQLLLDYLKPTDSDLVQLAWSRAKKAKQIILDDGRVEPERVFVLDPESSDKQADESAGARVNFSLR